MKKLLTTILIFCALVNVQAQSNLSPEVNAYLGNYKSAVKHRSAQASQQQTIVTLRLKADANAWEVAQQVEALGAEVKVTLGNQLTVALTAEQIEPVSKIEGVDLVERIKRGTPRLDTSLSVTQADLVHKGTEQVPQAYTGAGVVMALIDAGYDFTNPMFKDNNNNLRIKAVYYPGITDTKAHKAIIDGKKVDGSLYDTPELILNPDIYGGTGSHGTHCASIAAGSHITDADMKGLTGKPIGGMAPGSDIILLNTAADDAQLARLGSVAADNLNTALALKFISEYGKSQQKPVVLSWSENMHDGFHDGTSASAQAIRNFCEEGNIAVICASNEGGDSMHVHKKVKAGETLKLMIDDITADPKSYTFFVTNKPVKMQVGIYDTYEKKAIKLSETMSSADNVSVSLDVKKEPSENSGALEKNLWDLLNQEFSSRSNTEIELAAGTGKAADGSDRHYVRAAFLTQNNSLSSNAEKHIILYFTPEEDCEVFSWCDNTGYMKYDGFTEGTSSISMGDYSTSGKAVTIGAWAAQNKSMDLDRKITTNNQFKVGDIAYFSSYGTDYAGHKIPDACTPGTNVVAAINSFQTDESIDRENPTFYINFKNQYIGQKGEQSYFFAPKSGTSMATPTAAGIVALWVQAAKDKGKTLTNEDVKDIINHACDTDEYTKAKPERFGVGKLNAYKGLLYVLGLSTGISELSQHQPAGVTFRVENGMLTADGAEDGTSVTLYNLSGTIVRQATLQGGSISLAGLQRGVYAVQLGKLGSTLIRL